VLQLPPKLRSQIASCLLKQNDANGVCLVANATITRHSGSQRTIRILDPAIDHNSTWPRRRLLRRLVRRAGSDAVYLGHQSAEGLRAGFQGYGISRD